MIEIITQYCYSVIPSNGSYCSSSDHNELQCFIYSFKFTVNISLGISEKMGNMCGNYRGTEKSFNPRLYTCEKNSFFSKGVEQ